SKTIVTETQYDVRGAVRRTSLPYFEVGGTASWRTFTPDPMGRVIRTDYPDGTRTLSCFDDWVTVSIKTDNHRQRQTRDAAGRLLRVDEYLGTFTTCDVSVGS